MDDFITSAFELSVFTLGYALIWECLSYADTISRIFQPEVSFNCFWHHFGPCTQLSIAVDSDISCQLNSSQLDDKWLY